MKTKNENSGSVELACASSLRNSRLARAAPSVAEIDTINYCIQIVQPSASLPHGGDIGIPLALLVVVAGRTLIITVVPVHLNHLRLLFYGHALFTSGSPCFYMAPVHTTSPIRPPLSGGQAWCAWMCHRSPLQGGNFAAVRSLFSGTG